VSLLLLYVNFVLLFVLVYTAKRVNPPWAVGQRVAPREASRRSRSASAATAKAEVRGVQGREEWMVYVCVSVCVCASVFCKYRN